MNATQLTLDGGINERQFQRLANNEVHHSGMVGAPYKSGSATSKAAAEKIAPKVSRLEGYVLDALFRHPDGLTDEQIDRACQSEYVTFPTLRPRRIGLSQWVYRQPNKVVSRHAIKQPWPASWLIREPLVEATGETRPTQFGNKAVVHRLTEEGRKVAEERARQ